MKSTCITAEPARYAWIMLTVAAVGLATASSASAQMPATVLIGKFSTPSPGTLDFDEEEAHLPGSNCVGSWHTIEVGYSLRIRKDLSRVIPPINRSYPYTVQLQSAFPNDWSFEVVQGASTLWEKAPLKLKITFHPQDTGLRRAKLAIVPNITDPADFVIPGRRRINLIGRGTCDGFDTDGDRLFDWEEDTNGNGTFDLPPNGDHSDLDDPNTDGDPAEDRDDPAPLDRLIFSYAPGQGDDAFIVDRVERSNRIDRSVGLTELDRYSLEDDSSRLETGELSLDSDSGKAPMLD